VDLREMSEMLAKMVSSVWLARQEPLVTKELVDHLDFQERLVLTANLEPLVFLDVVERRALRVCRDHQAQPENQDLSVWLDHQVPPEDQESAEKGETLDRKELPDRKDREEPPAPLVSRERRAPLDPRVKRV